MTAAATRDASYWRARAQEYRDDMETFRLSPEKEDAYRAEAAFCDAAADAIEKMAGKAGNPGGKGTAPAIPAALPAAGGMRYRSRTAAGRERPVDPLWVDAAGVGV